MDVCGDVDGPFVTFPLPVSVLYKDPAAPVRLVWALIINPFKSTSGLDEPLDGCSTL